MVKNRRLISIIAALAFCLSFLAPALIAPAPAVAATTYTAVMGVPQLTTAGQYMSPLRIMDTSDTVGSIVGSTITVYLPAGVQYDTKPLEANKSNYLETPAQLGDLKNIFALADIAIQDGDCTEKRIVFTINAATNLTPVIEV